jgi:aspartyl-tRNA(Asn)/glutamyl-tRNA(Gln) amidotransferase subunit A
VTPATGAREIAERVRSGETADRFFLEALDRARKADSGPDGLHAFLSLAAPVSGASGARRGDGPSVGSRSGGAGPGAPEKPLLEGVPVAVKDNLCTLDLPTSCASRILEGYVSPYEATAVRRLRAHGARIVGKTNMDEFAMGSSTENSAFGPTLNPRDRSCVPGGSSGGSAAAVAAGVVPCALGSDTGGSVRQPASFCGIVGIKPTYGRVSRYGLVAFASSLDQVGTLGATVDDAALLLQAIAGHDPRDATSARREVPDWSGGAEPSSDRLDGLRVGVPTEYFTEDLDPEVRRLADEALERLRSAGAEVSRVSLPHTSYAVPTYYILAPAEASSNLARYDGVRYGLRWRDARSIREVYEESRTRGFGSEVIRRIAVGTFALSAGYYDAYYGKAQKVRALISGDFDRVWSGGADLLFTPTSPTPAFPLGERTADPLSMYLSDVYTVTANLAGIPGMSLPIGSVRGLPVGGQLLAPRWEEGRMIRAGRVLERLLQSEGAPSGAAGGRGGKA